ncbi:MAG: hypothetical protein V4539_00970 [Bacteroidota bacterium]
MSSPNEVKERIYTFLAETSEIFSLLKKYTLLVEEKLPEHKAPIHAANELKSLVFHLYDAVNHPDHIDTNILEAKEHLCRAFYDMHNVTVSLYIESIKAAVDSYSSVTRSTVFPDYTSIIRPQIRIFQEQLREIRARRNTNIAQLAADVSAFSEQVRVLATFDDHVEDMKKDMDKFDEEKEAEKKKERREAQMGKGWDIAKILLTAVISGVITYYITVAKLKVSASPVTTQSSKDSGH